MLIQTVNDEYQAEGKGWQETWDRVFVLAGVKEEGEHAHSKHIEQVIGVIADGWEGPSGMFEEKLGEIQQDPRHPLAVNFDGALRWTMGRRPCRIAINGMSPNSHQWHVVRICAQ